ncbi:uncharacterized protein MYCFIDRAFT_84406 [Pseudocercospora fijiensis CIRAD86]|uniref:Uncharacterized protein n=1 Tax=Pseudocercospora fijiensis (strain CIRAD86) TaxID=383855 RepID=M2ZD04_PSEFD|nr:uncharacterized protein MYCFIDRAFT_84406 [Pseudocercospora fijiensis CIRAD86]EME76999.1 hypothetical protein MYCFIDRAFT_84406 [Pseudocercospora fijiensis CIRAD86]
MCSPKPVADVTGGEGMERFAFDQSPVAGFVHRNLLETEALYHVGFSHKNDYPGLQECFPGITLASTRKKPSRPRRTGHFRNRSQLLAVRCNGTIATYVKDSVLNTQEKEESERGLTAHPAIGSSRRKKIVGETRLLRSPAQSIATCRSLRTLPRWLLVFEIAMYFWHMLKLPKNKQEGNNALQIHGLSHQLNRRSPAIQDAEPLAKGIGKNRLRISHLTDEDLKQMFSPGLKRAEWILNPLSECAVSVQMPHLSHSDLEATTERMAIDLGYARVIDGNKINYSYSSYIFLVLAMEELPGVGRTVDVSRKCYCPQ